MLYIVKIDIDSIDSPADVNPKGTSATAEGKKRTSASVAKDYGYCILSELLSIVVRSVKKITIFFTKCYLFKFNECLGAYCY